jgi:GNAT superfamily N-acetyltransferase
MIDSQTFDSADPTVPVRIGAVSAEEAIGLIPELIELLRDSVRDGASVGFLHPLSHSVARQYWLSVLPEIRNGSRMLLVAVAPDRLLGTVQLALPSFPSALHRAKVEKLLVDSSVQGQDFARMLMQQLHELARQHGRTLLLLGTRKGADLEAFSRELGYVEAGVIPGYTWGANGEPCDYVQFYLNVERREGARVGTQVNADWMAGYGGSDRGFKY